mmetsp:Transcript_20512/g.31222  ORF Transcript_20512/g.31222 Transcript_20512/m.31222 type:complete len:82 (-) Transcript_20512:513-758(-)
MNPPSARRELIIPNSCTSEQDIVLGIPQIIRIWASIEVAIRQVSSLSVVAVPSSSDVGRTLVAIGVSSDINHRGATDVDVT